MGKKERATLNITLETKSQLDAIKASGQSYDGVIRELVKFYKERRQDYWTRRRETKLNSRIPGWQTPSSLLQAIPL